MDGQKQPITDTPEQHARVERAITELVDALHDVSGADKTILRDMVVYGANDWYDGERDYGDADKAIAAYPVTLYIQGFAQ